MGVNYLMAVQLTASTLHLYVELMKQETVLQILIDHSCGYNLRLTRLLGSQFGSISQFVQTIFIITIEN